MMDTTVSLVIPDVHKEEKSQEVDIEDRILHLLTIFPKISPSMMQIGIGSALPPRWWKPVLEKLIKSGKVQMDHIVSTTSTGRTQTYTVLSLPVLPVLPAPSAS